MRKLTLSQVVCMFYWSTDLLINDHKSKLKYFRISNKRNLWKLPWESFAVSLKTKALSPTNQRNSVKVTPVWLQTGFHYVAFLPLHCIALHCIGYGFRCLDLQYKQKAKWMGKYNKTFVLCSVRPSLIPNKNYYWIAFIVLHCSVFFGCV